MSEFANVGTGPGTPGSEAGIWIWRVENKVCVPVSPEFFGQFYSGDSYICLFTTRRSATSSTLDHAIHFWLGSESSQDEIGIAAYKTVELDEQLGGSPVQHRETQGHETPAFVQHFGNGVTYLDGGVASGFNHVVRGEHEPRLLHLKGARTVRTRQVPVSAGSLNAGDVFILDAKEAVYQWNGKSANRWEKARGLQMGTFIRDEERGAQPRLEVVDQGAEPAEFWAALGGEGEVAAAVDDDAGAGAGGVQDVKLFRVSDADGELKTTEIEERPISQGMLDTNDVFIVDCGTEIFVWIGKGSTAEEKKGGMKTGTGFIEAEGRPSWTAVTRVIEGGETVLFKDKFSDWKTAGALLPGMPTAIAGRGVAGSVEQKEIDYAAIYAAQKESEGESTLDPAGKVEMWRIEDFAKVDIDPAFHGQFHAGDSYVILYTWPEPSREKPVIFFWQGRDSTQDERGASAYFAQELDNAMGGMPVQVRVVQGKEPTDFLSLFKGKMVVHEGGVASGFKNRADGDSTDQDGVSLFHVRGTSELNTRAVQVPEEAKSLNSADVFVLLTPEKCLVWRGMGANAEEHTAGDSIAQVLSQGREVAVIEEGSEPEEFWTPLGGKGEYAATPELRDAPREPRLFELCDATGSLSVEEIFDFAQDDLHDDNVLLLDTHTTLYVWTGTAASEREKRESFAVAEKYLAAAGRGSTAIVRVAAGEEPPMFTANFLGWSAEKAEKFVDPYQAKLDQLRKEKEERDAAQAKLDAPSAAAPAEPAQSPAPAADASADSPAPAAAPSAAASSAGPAAAPGSKTYTYAELLERPGDVDMTCREAYLSDAEFEEVFKMDKAAFAALAKWKQADAKKKVNLF